MNESPSQPASAADTPDRPFDIVLYGATGFTGGLVADYLMRNMPEGGSWAEVLNSDAPVYGGSGVGNLGRVDAEQVPMNGRGHSVRLSVPPLGAVVLVPERLAEG